MTKCCSFCGESIMDMVSTENGDAFVCEDCVKLANAVFARRKDVGKMKYISRRGR